MPSVYMNYDYSRTTQGLQTSSMTILCSSSFRINFAVAKPLCLINLTAPLSMPSVLLIFFSMGLSKQNQFNMQMHHTAFNQFTTISSFFFTFFFAVSTEDTSNALPQ